MSELGPMPTPKIEPAEPEPGGADAVDGGANGTIPDLSPADNPSIDEKAPDALKQKVSEGEDTSTRATRDAEGEDEEPEKESPA